MGFQWVATKGFYAVESFEADIMPNLQEFIKDESKLELLLETIRKVEIEESLMGFTCHNLAP